MACNVPVLATEDNRASEIEGVWVAPADNFNLGQAFVQMALSFENDSVNLREEFVVGKLDEITYAKNLEKVL
jgi:hypothetical protein